MRSALQLRAHRKWTAAPSIKRDNAGESSTATVTKARTCRRRSGKRSCSPSASSASSSTNVSCRAATCPCTSRAAAWSRPWDPTPRCRRGHYSSWRTSTPRCMRPVTPPCRALTSQRSPPATPSCSKAGPTTSAAGSSSCRLVLSIPYCPYFAHNLFRDMVNDDCHAMQLKVRQGKNCTMKHTHAGKMPNRSEKYHR